MLTLYLACLIFGGSLVAVSMLGGLDSDDVEVHIDGDLDDGDLAMEDHSAAGHGVTEAARFMSFRSLVFFRGRPL